ncbi:MAG: hypothetical protein PHF05_05575, partial [Candidatus Izemoplasmatales bacterium]|nr:hypothetical protein [Candidatus Izemoplasmatales bacterium]
FTDLELGEIYTVSLEVDYTINENVYTNVFVNKRVNLKPFESEYEKKSPSNFSLQITRNDSINGFEVFVTYDDPDKTLTKMYLMYDGEKEIISKSIGGYLYQMYNAEEGKNYSFKIEYFYRIDTINPVSEVTSATYFYKYETEEEPPITTEITTTSSETYTTITNDSNDRSALDAIAVLTPIFLIGLVGLIYIVRRKK